MQRLSAFGTQHIGPWMPDRLTMIEPLRVSQIISAPAQLAIPRSQHPPRNAAYSRSSCQSCLSKAVYAVCC